MSEVNQGQLRDDELHLRGRLQFETALAAITLTGLCPATEKTVAAMLDIHPIASDGVAQNDLSLYLQGGTVAAEKIDLINSLRFMTTHEHVSPSQRGAARGLLEVMGVVA